MAANNYLSVAEIDPEDFFGEASAYPNPFNDMLNLAFSAERSFSYKLSLMDMTGRTVVTEERSATEGGNLLSLSNLEEIPSGIYFLRIESGKAVFNTKVVKQ
jgi:hypothetical protein